MITKFSSVCLLLLLLIAGTAVAQSPMALESAFHEAASRFSMPVDVIKGVAYVETRVWHNIPSADAACSGMPPAYGVMGLRDDNWFGHSLVAGAALIGESVGAVKADFRLNILAGAALLASFADQAGINKSDINAWKPVLERYSGIPQADVKDFYSFDVFKVLAEGALASGVVINKQQGIDFSVFRDEVNPANKLKNIESDDYAPAVWDPSPNFTTNGITRRFAVVHTTEGGFAGSLSWLKNPAASASSHYIIRSSDGYIVQLVREANRAWHAVCWNSNMLGVEHEAFVAQPSYFTDAMYIASAALYRHFCDAYNIAINRNYIIGHYEWQNTAWKTWMAANFPSIDPTCNTHTDPGQYWDWAFYLQLVSQDTTRPKVLSYTPASAVDSVLPNAQIKIKFDHRMKRAETQAAFSILPAVSGSFTWEDNGKTMVFTPNTLYQLGAQYTVSLAGTAVNYINRPVNPVSFNFVTLTTSSLALSSVFPRNNQANATSTVKVIISFSSPLLQSSLSGGIFFQDSAGINVSMRNPLYSEVGGKGIVTFSPLSKLAGARWYKIIVKGTIKNVANVPLGRDSVIWFRTAPDNFVQGTFIDDFEAAGGWQDPNFSGSTVGTDPALTTFAISTEEKVSGTSSGKITYVFTGSNGVCRTFNNTKPSVGSVATDRIGVWVYGDLSNNLLEFWFYYNTSTNTIVVSDTLNFTGWRFIEFPVSSIGGTGDRLFHSVVIKQAPGGAASSFIYVDGLQKRDPNATGTGNDLNSGLPAGFSLGQNFPNPFNPSTVISYSLPAEGYITLKLYNVLGGEVAMLFSGQQAAGTWSFSLDAGKYNLAAGTYLYRLEYNGSGGHTSLAKKLVYLK